jgi:hypothetical protein
MTSSARIRRGFSRIGVALATVFAIVAVGGGAAITVDHWRKSEREFEQAQCVAAWEENHLVEVDHDPWAAFPLVGKADKNSAVDTPPGFVLGPPPASPPAAPAPSASLPPGFVLGPPPSAPAETQRARENPAIKIDDAPAGRAQVIPPTPPGFTNS